MSVIKKHLTTLVLFTLLLILSIWSLFIGVLDVELSGLLQRDSEHLEIFLISRLPRLCLAHYLCWCATWQAEW